MIKKRRNFGQHCKGGTENFVTKGAYIICAGKFKKKNKEKGEKIFSAQLCICSAVEAG